MPDEHEFPCPCCHKNLAFDPETGKVREVQTAKEKASPGMDKLLDAQTKDKQRLADTFTEATKAQSSQTDRFDDLFADALEQAKKDKDKKPRKPFDMD